MSYRRAKSLDKLVAQVNALYPNRDKASDGWIGDAAHKSSKSDHNAWVKLGKLGIVTAQDIDKDLSHTVKVGTIVNELFASKDPRIKYLIFNDRITERDSKGIIYRWVPYKGKNAHREHFHISVKSDVKFFDDDSDWAISGKPDLIVQYELPKERVLYYKVPMMSGEDVKNLQSQLVKLKYLPTKADDGVFGTKTQAAVKQFQRDNQLKADGKVGTLTREKLKAKGA